MFFQGINTTLAIPEIASKRLTISFVAATPDQAKIDGFGGLLKTPAFGADLKPQLNVDGAVRAEGRGLGLGHRLVNFLQLSFRRGPFTTLETVAHQGLSVGGRYAIVLDTQRSSTLKNARAAQRLRTAIAAASGEGLLNDAVAGEFLSLAGLVFFTMQDRFVDHLAGSRNTLAMQPTNEALLRLDLAIDGANVKLGDLVIDNQRNEFDFFSRDAAAGFDRDQMRFALSAGSSNLEEELFRYVLGAPAVSTTAFFREASNLEIPIVVLTKDNIAALLPQLRIGPFERGAVSVAVAEGRQVWVPQEGFGLMDWSGIGWVEHPHKKGGASMFISGRLAGGQSIVGFQGDSGLTDDNALVAFGKLILSLVRGELFSQLSDQVCKVFGCNAPTSGRSDAIPVDPEFEGLPAVRSSDTGSADTNATSVVGSILVASFPNNTAADTNFAPALRPQGGNPTDTAAKAVANGVSDQTLAQITARNGPVSTQEGVGKFAAGVDIRSLILATLTSWTTAYASYSGFIYVRNFDTDIGVDYRGNATNRMRVVVNSKNEVIKAYPVPRVS